VIGDYATTFIPPNVKAYKNFDLYDSVANPEGQPDKAQAIMTQKAGSGHPCPSSVTVAYKDTPLYQRLVQTMVVAYQLAGIQVIPVPVDRSIYYTTGIGDPANNYDMMVAGWVPDWANGSAILPPTFDGRNIPPLDATGHAAGNVNFSLLKSPTIEGEIDAAEAEADPDRSYALWGDLDEEIQKLAVTIPILYEKAVLMTGSNVLGGYIHPAFGQPDLVSLGLAQP
jgi:peptide/nickel transport system substrate-binding protein